MYHTDNTVPNAVDIAPQTLNNSNFLYFIIIHSYPALFYIIIQKQNF
jgi:hypothetical protein